jgi:hypothetical protein
VMNIQQYLREFIAKAEAKYPEWIDQNEFTDLLATLYGSARLILSETSFHRWVYEKAEVERFLARRIHLNRYDVHVKGSPIGHYKIMIYENEQNVFEYVEVEWIGHGGNVASNQKVFKLSENAEVPPLGEVITTLSSFEMF